MKIFEFQFNPKAKKDRFFRVFSFEPQEKADEERGSLYIIGELQNALPSSENFLQILADLIFKEYAASAKTGQEKKRKFSPATSLKTSLRKANDFLAAESKKGNVDWLGNISLGILLYIPINGGYTMYFTKVGGMKIWMARNGSLVDVGKSLEKEKDAASAKVFGNVGSGKIVPEDRVAVVTKELFDIYTKENLLQPIAQFKEEKQFKDLFKTKEKILSQISGVLLFFFMEPLSKQQQDQPLKVPSLPTKLPNIRMPSLPSFKRPNLSLPMLKIKAPRVPPLLLPKAGVLIPEKLKPKMKLHTFHDIPLLKKTLGLLFILAVILGIGFAIFKGTAVSPEAVAAQAALEATEILQFQGARALTLEDEEEANRLYQEAWEKIRPYRDREEFQVIAHEIDTQLQKLNSITFIGNPDLFVRLDISAVPEAPQKVLAVGGTLYFFHPFSSQVIATEISSKAQAILSPGRNLRFGDNFQETFVFFADPNILVAFNESSGWQEHEVLLPNNFSPQGLASFGSNIYVFDGSAGQIVKASLSKQNTETWVSASSEKKPLDALSIVIDGNIWVLKPKGEVQRYFKGEYEESLEINVFPSLEKATKIYTRAQLPYLYILDTENARILVVTKFGDVIRQYQSPPFGQASDFVVSADGEILYVLVGQEVYQIADILIDS